MNPTQKRFSLNRAASKQIHVGKSIHIMKQSIALLAVMGTLLACSEAVFAAAVKTAYMPEPWTSTVEGGIHASAFGFVTVSPVKGGGVNVTVQLQKAAPRYTYVVKSNGQVLGKFTTNAKGTGGLQVFVADPSTLGRWVNIWQTAGEPYGSYWGAPPDGTYEDWNGHVANGTTDEFDGLGLLYGYIG